MAEPGFGAFSKGVAEGLSAAYERQPPPTPAEEGMTGPAHPGAPPLGTDIKNPEGQFQHPAPMGGASRGLGLPQDKPVEPAGQQGSTGHGRR